MRARILAAQKLARLRSNIERSGGYNAQTESSAIYFALSNPGAFLAAEYDAIKARALASHAATCGSGDAVRSFRGCE